MLAPLSWLKDYIDITLKPKELAERLTEVGLGCEKMHETGNDIILDLEITPNRPDCLSILGVAREIAALENKKIAYPHLKTDLKPQGKILPLIIHTNYQVTPRLTGIIINNVTVQESPQWLKEKLEKIGQRPINNIVDITNFVMFELGNPIHSFDYHKIADHEFWTRQAKGGEVFESVDGVSYHLPKGAIIYEDKEKIFDLVGIKGGKNSGTYENTKAVFIAVEVDSPVLIRKTSQALSLRSEASSIFERGVNKGGTLDALKRNVDLILELAGGEIASEVYDLKDKSYEPWKAQLRLDRLEYILGIKIPEKEVIELLDRLNLSPALVCHPEFISVPHTMLKQVQHDNKEHNENACIIECTIPTYRNDLHIEEDLIEEVARLYGYNNFPKTLPIGQISPEQIPYFKDYRMEEKIKNILTATGFSEIYSYSLLSEKDLELINSNSEHMLRIDNPVSRDYEYLRPTLRINLLKALRQNKALSKQINFFELGKVYRGRHLNEMKEEYHLAGISNSKNFAEIKGILEKVYEGVEVSAEKRVHDTFHTIGDSIEILDEGIYFEINYSKLIHHESTPKHFIPVPKYPPIVEDISLIVDDDIKVGDIIHEIQNQSPLISEVSLLDLYENTKTFHIVYLDREKNLTSEEVGKIREKILATLKKNLGLQLKTA